MGTSLIEPSATIMLMLAFLLAMLAVVSLQAKDSPDAPGFLLAGRNISLIQGALSIAVSWLWAPAIFICSLQAYTKGLPGIFWFTAPNILCFFVFAPVAIRARRLFPAGYTLPECISKRFAGSKRVHLVYLFVYLGYQLGGVSMNALAGGLLLSQLSGLDFRFAAVCMTLVALAYSLIGGLRASVVTDAVQMGLILLFGLILVPWAVHNIGGVSSVARGLGGASGEYQNLLNPWVAFSMGIPMTLGLLAGPFADQMFYQRAMAVNQRVVARTFILGGLIFGIVPIVLSILGFIGADLAARGMIEVRDPQLIGPIVLAYLLPKYALYAFALMAVAALCSTIDSALCAVSSLGSIDYFLRYRNPQAAGRDIVRFSRRCMLSIAVLGTVLTFLNPKLIWLFLIYGSLSSSIFFPTVFSLLSKTVSEAAVFWGVILSLLIGLPLSWHANVNENPYLIVAAALLSAGIGLTACLLSVIRHRLRERTSIAGKPADWSGAEQAQQKVAGL